MSKTTEPSEQIRALALVAEAAVMREALEFIEHEGRTRRPSRLFMGRTPTHTERG